MALSASAAKKLAAALPANDTSRAAQAEFVRAYWEVTVAGARDRNGNVLYEGREGQSMRVHIDGEDTARAQVQWQTKVGKTWKTVQSSPVRSYFDHIADQVSNATGGPTAADRAAVMHAEQERVARKVAETWRDAGVLALKHAAAGLSLNELARAIDADSFSAQRPEEAFVGDLKRLVDRYAGVIQGGMTVGDDAFGSVDRPPMLPLLVPVEYAFSGKVDGSQAMVGITNAAEHQAQVAALCGEAIVKGTVRIEPWGLAGRLTAVTGKGPSVGRAVALWCQVLRGYGVAVWEVEPKLKATVAKLPEVMLATEGHRVLGRCVGAGFQLGLPGMRPNR